MGKSLQQNRGVYWLFVNILCFSLVFPMQSEWSFYFSQEKLDFSQNCGFFGEVVGKALFCLIFHSTFASSKKQDNAEMVWCS